MIEALVVLAAAPAPSGFYEVGLGRFLISPGFGGVAVLIGGALAFFAARRSSAETRARTAIDAETARQERWWATLTWIYDRATAEREQARLTTTLALDLLDRLSRQAHTEVEYESVLGLIEAFTDERQEP